MRVYVEFVFLDNFAMDYLLLYTVGKCWWPAPSKRRCAGTALVGAVYAIVAPMRGWTFLLHPAVKVLMSVGLVGLAYRPRTWPSFFKRFAAFWTLSLLAAGALIGAGALAGGLVVSGGMLAMSGPPLWLALLTLWGVFTGGHKLFYALKRRAAALPQSIEVELVWQEQTISVAGLVDTGSQLHDPSTGQPVILLPRGVLPGLEEISEQTAGAYSLSLAQIPYRTIDGPGWMTGFYAKDVTLRYQARVQTLQAVFAFVPDARMRRAIVPAQACIDWLGGAE